MENIDQKILAYLDGDLPEPERVTFEGEIAKNVALATAVNEHKELRDLLTTYRKELPDREAIGNIYQKIKTEESTAPDYKPGQNGKVRKFPFAPMALLMAAAIALLIWIVWPSGGATSLSSEELFAETFQPAPAEQTMGAMDDGQVAYGQQQYDVAISHFQHALEDSTSRSEAAFYLSQCYLAKRQFTEANASLKLVTNRSQEVRWYRALAALGQGDVDGVRQLLQPIVNDDNHDFHEEGKRLLERLGDVKRE